MHFYLGQTKLRTENYTDTRKIQDYTGSKVFSNGNSFTSLYCVSKELNIPLLSAKCAIAQVRCFKKWKNSNCIISALLKNISSCRCHPWDKESNILAKKLDKFPSKKAIVNFYRERDMAGNFDQGQSL